MATDRHVTTPDDQGRERTAARLAIPAPVYRTWWRKRPHCHVCRRKFPTVADYRSHYLKEHR